MKVNELPENTNILNYKIKLTPELQEAYANYSSKGEDEIYLVGSCMGDWFISPTSPNENKERPLYSMPLSVNPQMFLECEVILK